MHTITLMKLKIYDVKLKVSQLQESSQFSEIIDLALLLKPLLDLGKLLNFICDCYYDQDQGELSNLKLNLMMIKLIIIFYSYSYCDGQTQWCGVGVKLKLKVGLTDLDDTELPADCSGHSGGAELLSL